MDPVDPILPRPVQPPPILRSAPVRRTEREREREREQREQARRRPVPSAPDLDDDVEDDDGRAHVDVTA